MMLVLLHQLLDTVEAQAQLPLEPDSLQPWAKQRQDLLIALTQAQEKVDDPGEVERCMKRILTLDRRMEERIQEQLSELRISLSAVRTARSYQDPNRPGSCIDQHG